MRAAAIVRRQRTARFRRTKPPRKRL